MDFNDIRSYSDHGSEFEYFFQELTEASKCTPAQAIFCEIGTREGGSALLALEAIKASGIKHPMITVDPYGFKPFHNSDSTQEKLYGEPMYHKAMKLLSSFCLVHDLYHAHFKLTSFDFMDIFDKVEIWHNEEVLKPVFGFVYLDGEHNEITVQKELEWFLARMPVGGLIVIDDIEHVVNSKIESIKDVLSKSRIKSNRSFYTKE